MRRSTIVVIMFVLVAAGVVGASLFLRSQPPLEVTIAVSPLAADWAQAAADAYNETEPLVNGTRRILVRVEALDDVALWTSTRTNWTDATRPDGWIPALAVSIDVARNLGQPVEVIVPALATTPLVWGGFTPEVEALIGDGSANLDWPVVQAGIASVRPAFPNPATTTAGFAVVASGAAAFNDTARLTADSFGSPFRDWIAPVLDAVANYNTLGASVAQTLAARGPSVGALALLPEAEWLLNRRGQLAGDQLRLAYPAYPFLFTFGYALWGRDLPDADEADRAAAVRAFGTYLQGTAAQTRLTDFALRPASGIAPNSGAFADSAANGAILIVDPTLAITLPTGSGDLLRVLSWVDGIVR